METAILVSLGESRDRIVFWGGREAIELLALRSWRVPLSGKFGLLELVALGRWAALDFSSWIDWEWRSGLGRVGN